MMGSWNPTETSSATSRMLFAVRRHLGAVLGWDDPAKQWRIPGCTETTLLDRLPNDLRLTAAGAPGGSDAMRRLGAHLVPLYRTDQEAAAEISNATAHGVLQFAWVEQRRGGYQGRLAVYVKPRGKLGRAYLLLIQPFRHLIVYPALLCQVEGASRAKPATSSSMMAKPPLPSARAGGAGGWMMVTTGHGRGRPRPFRWW